MNKNLVCVMAVGDKYVEQLQLVHDNIKGYADKCRADFRIISTFPDTSKKRGGFYQKLLIPDLYQAYEMVLFLDLDTLISPNCPSLFEMMPEGIGLMAEVNPRNSEKFKRVYGHDERILKESVEDYFLSRGFEKCDGLIGNINGGVLLFRPALVAEKFKNYYYSEVSQGKYTAFEEAPMAYLTQSTGIFKELDGKFNRMPFFEIGRPEFRNLFAIHKTFFYKSLSKFSNLVFSQNIFLISAHRKLIKKLFDEGAYIVHFAGGFWSKRLYRLCKDDLMSNFSASTYKK